MGRGRAKAKQTKVARRLKYSTPQMDLEALREELSGSGEHPHLASDDIEETDDEFDGDYERDYEDWDDDEDDDRSS